MTLSRWFSHKTAAFYTEQCTSPMLSHNFEVSRGTSIQSLKNCMASFAMLFSSFVVMHTNHLATKCDTVQDCWVRNMVGVHGGKESLFIHCWLGVWTEPGQWFSQRILHTSKEEACEDRLAAPVIDGKLELKQHPLLKNDINKFKMH